MFASDLPQIASVFPFQRQSAMFQHPLVRSEVFPAITAVVALAPAAVHQRLYRTTMQVTVSKLSQVKHPCLNAHKFFSQLLDTH